MAVVRYKGELGTSFDERNKYTMSRRNAKNHLKRERDQKQYSETKSGVKKRPPRGSKATTLGKSRVKRGVKFSGRSSSTHGAR